MKKKIHTLLCIGMLFATLTNAQMLNGSVLNTGGGSQEMDGFSLEWNIGESASVLSYSKPEITLTEGLLQPLCFQTLGALYQDSKNFYFTQIYPTITSGNVFLKFKMPNFGLIKILVQNNVGQHVYYKEISSGFLNTENITLPLLGKGVYHVFLEYNIPEIPKNRRDHFLLVKQ